MKGAWWWNGEVKEKVEEKKEAYAVFTNSGTDKEKDINRVRYRAAKKVAKKAVVAKSVAYDRLYQKLETKKGEKEVCKLARVKERRTRDLGVVECIKDENGRVLCEDAGIKQRWQMYLSKLLNGKMMKDYRSRSSESTECQLDPRFYEPINKDEIKESLRKMANGMVEGPH